MPRPCQSDVAALLTSSESCDEASHYELLHTMQAGANGGSESIGVVPNKLMGNCEVLLLVLSALDGDTGTTDLTSAADLSFKLASVGKLPQPWAHEGPACII